MQKENLENELLESTVCKNCNDPKIEQGYSFPLCGNCRKMFSKQPLPIWIKGFFGLTMIILAIALLKFPERLEAAVFFEKGLQAEQSRRYLSAVRNYQKVLKTYPDSAPVLARLGISYFQSNQIQESAETLMKLSGRNLSNQELVAEVNYIISRIETLYIPDQELNQILESRHEPAKLATKLRAYLENKPSNIVGLSWLANSLFDLQRYNEVESICLEMIERQPDFDPAYSLLAATYREKKEYEKGSNYCMKMLERNIENPIAYVTLSRIELKRHHDLAGLQYAEKAYGFDSESPYTIANLALAYHYNNQYDKRDETIELLKKAKNHADDLKKLMAIINGAEKWRE